MGFKLNRVLKIYLALSCFSNAAQITFIVDMSEETIVAGICNSNKIESVMMCVAYLNRMKGDSVSKEYTKQELKSWMDRAISIVLNYIKLHKMDSC